MTGDDDRDAEEILKRLLKEDDPSVSQATDERVAAALKQVNGAASSAAASPARSAQAAEESILRDIFGKGNAAVGANELSLQGESDVLQAIIDALKDTRPEEETENAEIMAALRHAERVAAAGVSNKATGQSVLRMHEVHGLADQLKRARTTVGPPSCIDAGSPSSGVAFAIGTTVGFALLFDNRCRLLGVCGGAGHGVEGGARGSCVSVAINYNGTLLATGHDRGTVIIWDTETLQPLKTITGEFQEPVFRTRFLNPDPLKAFAVDGTGVIKIFSFARVMKSLMVRTVEIETHLSSMCSDVAATCVTVVDPETHESRDVHYLAAVCPEEVAVYRVVFGFGQDVSPFARIPVPPGGDTNNATEVLAWVTKPSGPVLCVCWGTRVDLWSVVGDELIPTGTIYLPTMSNAVCVLDGGCLLLGDEKKSVGVLDSAAGVLVEQMQLFSIEPVSYSHRSCGIRHQGGYCHANGVAFILGAARVLACSIMPWESRLDTLVGLKLWPEALALARGFATETALAVVGLSSTPSMRKASVNQYITTLLTSYIADVMRKSPKPEEIRPVMATIIGFCSDIGAIETLFGPVSLFFETLGVGKTFFAEVLAALIAGSLTSLPSETIAQLVEFCLDDKDFMALTGCESDDAPRRLHFAEDALMHVTGQDEILLGVAKEHGLWRLVCVVWMVRRRQPESVVVDLCGVADDALAEFITTLFHGLTYLPGSSLDSSTAKQFTSNVLAALQDHPQAINRVTAAAKDSCLAAFESAAAEPSLWFPNTAVKKAAFMQRLKNAITIPADKFKEPWRMEELKVPMANQIRCLRLYAACVGDGSVALEKKDLASFVNQVSFALAFAHHKAKDAALRLEYQRDLCKLFLAGDCAEVASPDVEKEFIAKKMIRPLAALKAAKNQFTAAISQYVDIDAAALRQDPGIRHEVFDFLGDWIERASNQKGWKLAGSLASLKSAIMQNLEVLVAVDATRLAKFVFRHLPSEHKEVLQVLAQTAGGANDAEAQYLFMREMITSGSATPSPEELTDFLVHKCVFEPDTIYQYLVDLDPSWMYDINAVLEVAKERSITDACIFLYEKTIMIAEAMELLTAALWERVAGARMKILQLSRMSTAEREAHMAQHQSALQQQHAAQDTAAAQDATFLSDAREVLRRVEAADENIGDFVTQFPEEEQMLNMVNVGIGLCKRYHKVITDTELPQIWFMLLDMFARPKQIIADRLARSQTLAGISAAPTTPSSTQGHVRRRSPSTISHTSEQNADMPGGHSEELVDEVEAVRIGAKVAPLRAPLSEMAKGYHVEALTFYSKYVSYILSHMVQVLDLQTVVGKIIHDNEREKFGPFKPILVGILQKLNFNLRAHELCKECSNDDVFALSEKLRRTIGSAITPTGNQCNLCGQHFSIQVEDHDTLKFFRCGHGYHDVCLKQQGECPRCAIEARFGPSSSLFTAAAPAASTTSAKLAARSPVPQAVGADSGKTDLQRMMRRMHHTTLKIEGSRNYREILDGLLAKEPGSGVTDARRVGSASARGLLLAPAPCAPVIGQLFVGRLADLASATIKEHFTDEEIADIFGADAKYNLDAPDDDDGPTPQLADMKEHSDDGHDHGGTSVAGDGGEKDDLDW
jgi:hypothetical protein